MSNNVQYITAIYDWNTPLYGGITANNVVSFLQLMNNNTSSFRKWYDTNKLKLDNMTDLCVCVFYVSSKLLYINFFI